MDISLVLTTIRDNKHVEKFVGYIEQNCGTNYELIIVSPLDYNINASSNTKIIKSACTTSVECFNLGMNLCKNDYIFCLIDDQIPFKSLKDYATFMKTNGFLVGNSTGYNPQNLSNFSIRYDPYDCISIPVVHKSIFDVLSPNSLRVLFNESFTHHWVDHWLGYWLTKHGYSKYFAPSYCALADFDQRTNANHDDHDLKIYRKLIQAYDLDNTIPYTYKVTIA